MSRAATDSATETFHLELKPTADPMRRQGVNREPIHRLRRFLKYGLRDCGFRIRWGQITPPVELMEPDDQEGGTVIRFTDGPAAGQRLMLKRAPLYLRVVFDTLKQKWGALDQEADTPSAGDVIYVYRRIGEPSAAMIAWTTGGKRRGSSCAMAMYKLAEQPDDATARDTLKWRAWCWEQVKKPPAGAS